MRILLLGGTGDALAITRQLLACEHDIIYSLAGLARLPELPCEVIHGGFSSGTATDGTTGMAQFIEARSIQLVIDATHPYAEQISAHAVAAAQRSGVPCWRYQRPPWPDRLKREPTVFTDLAQQLPALARFTRPFFTTGTGILALQPQRPAHQHWLVRTATPQNAGEGVTTLCARGPFAVTAEIALMRQHGIDALITKNSGGSQVVAKLQAAHELGVAVFMQQRPELAPADRVYAEPDTLVTAVNDVCTDPAPHRSKP